jgi:hypothetical protein
MWPPGTGAASRYGVRTVGDVACVSWQVKQQAVEVVLGRHSAFVVLINY